jgi:hypothetical protein
VSVLGKSARRVLDSEVRGMTAVLDLPAALSVRPASEMDSFRFAEVNPLTGLSFAESSFEDLPDCVAQVVTERLGFCAGEWDVLVEDHEVFDFVDPDRGYSLDAMSAGRLRAALLSDSEMATALTTTGAQLPSTGASGATVLNLAARGLDSIGANMVREIGQVSCYLHRAGNVAVLEELHGSVERWHCANELARGLDVRSVLRTRPAAVDTVAVIA